LTGPEGASASGLEDAPVGGPAVALGALAAPARDLLGRLGGLLGDRAAWLVGGAVRDLLRGQPVSELDVAVPAGALALGRALADALGAPWVLLDEARGACRVVGALQLDLADLRAPTLEADLRARDFTVNALAVPLHPLLARGAAAVEDATGGLADLRAGVLRLCAPGAMADDPVRVLRAARLSLALGLDLDPAVGEAARGAAPELARVSAERIRDELVALLGGPRGGRGLRLLDEWGALAVLLPEREAMSATPQPPPHRFDVWEHSLRAVEASDDLLAGLLRPGRDAGVPEAGAGGESRAVWPEGLAGHLGEDVGDGLTRAHAVKLAALLHDVAKPETRTEEAGRVRFIGHEVRGAERAGDIASRWRLSRRARTVLERLVRQHLRPMHLTQAGRITRRARYRFFRDLGQEAQDLLLLALADAAAVSGEGPWAVWRGPGGAVVRALFAGLGAERAAAAAPPLLRGEDVMAAFGLGPGPGVGRLLAAAREAQALGLVRSREQALAYLRDRAAGLLDTPGGAP
jgi:poly(A) polymerase/tRNA nucleotidyltransferase (CCA-adding enzyme)